MPLNKYRAPFDLTSIPEDLLFAEYRRRYKLMRELCGPYFALKKMRVCKGCHKEFSAREMRIHRCTISYKKR